MQYVSTKNFALSTRARKSPIDPKIETFDVFMHFFVKFSWIRMVKHATTTRL